MSLEKSCHHYFIQKLIAVLAVTALRCVHKSENWIADIISLLRIWTVRDAALYILRELIPQRRLEYMLAQRLYMFSSSDIEGKLQFLLAQLDGHDNGYVCLGSCTS